MSGALLVDIGNSRLKWALCGHGLRNRSAVVYDGAHPERGFERAWGRLLMPPAAVYASNVKGPEMGDALCTWCSRRWGLPVTFAVSARHFGEMVNGYRDPERLGVDRWLAMIAAWKQTPGSLCVVDCGTAVTVDVVDADGRHLGGLILPGKEALQASLLQRLPHLSNPERPAACADLGKDTRDAVRYGLHYATFAALRRIADDVRARCGVQTRFYVCGGGAAEMAPCLGSGSRQVQDLVLRGLADYFSLI